MSDFYTGMAQTASGLLTQFGKSMALRRTTPVTYDSVTGRTTGGGTEEDLPVAGLYVAMSKDYLETHQIETGDRLAILTGETEPKLTDKLVDGDSVKQIVGIDATNPAGTPLCYKVQVR